MRALGYYPTEQEVSIHETYSFFLLRIFSIRLKKCSMKLNLVHMSIQILMLKILI